MTPSRKRVLQVLYGGLGGHGSVAFSLLEADRGRAFEHALLFYGIEAPRAEYVARCEALGAEHAYVPKHRGPDPRALVDAGRAIRRARPDVVVLHSASVLPAAAALRAAGQRFRLLVVDHQANALKRRSEWLWSWMALRRADRLVCLTTESADELQRALRRWSRPRRLVVIGNGIDVERFSPPARPREPDGRTILGMQSRLAQSSKDHATLVRAAHRLREAGHRVELRIAGEGEARASIEALARSLGLSDAEVRLVGALDEPRLIEFLRGLDVYVHSTLGDMMSTAMMQAMAVGLPIVATDVPGMRALLGHEREALLTPVGDDAAMAGAVSRLIGDRALARSMGDRARAAAVRRHSHELMWARYRTIF